MPADPLPTAATRRRSDAAPAVLDAGEPLRPQPPKSIEETGLGLGFLIGLALKTMYVTGSDSVASLVDELKLSPPIVQSLIDRLRERQFIEPLASSARPDQSFNVHFVLSEAGRMRAVEAIAQSAYVGPAPVPIAAFETQIRNQRIGRERIDHATLNGGLAHLMLPQELVNRLGTALSAGRPILVYGPPGNGKSSMSLAAARCFRDTIYVPRCIEVGEQVIALFDPTVHTEVETEAAPTSGTALCAALRQGATDPRWVRCRRPVISTGVELTMDMLDLNFHPRAHFYDASLQMKASGGVLYIADFGKQLVRPIDILNRWIVPLDHGADYLTLETGRKFACAFDVQLVFATNLPLEEVMDTDIIRRIPYRIRVEPPTRDEFVSLLRRELARRDVALSEDVLTFLLDELYAAAGREFARYHPRFLAEHVIAHAKYHGSPPVLDRAILAEAMEGLFTRE